jgi:peptide/nickel transport system substrate-binding protein
VIKLIPNTATLEANLRSGTIDAISSLGLTFDQALAFEKKVKSENLPYLVEYKPSLTYEHIDLDLNNPILKDVRVRKAMLLSINRDDLVKALFDGKQTPAIHNFAKIDPWYTDDPKTIVTYPYSKRDAAKLLDEAGWKMGDDGYRHKDGKKLSLPFMTTAGNKIRETVQTYLQGQWKSVGIDIVIKNEPARVFFGETMRKIKYGGLAMYAWTSAPESDLKPSFHSSQIPTAKNGWSGQNYMNWSSKKVDEICEKMETEFDAKKRIALAHEFLKAYTDEVPVIPLYYRSDIAVSPLALKNFRLPGHQYSETNDAEKWTLVK